MLTTTIDSIAVLRPTTTGMLYCCDLALHFSDGSPYRCVRKLQSAVATTCRRLLMLLFTAAMRHTAQTVQ